jgi:DNA invertase Pin-like site-specific DNA recombinase
VEQLTVKGVEFVSNKEAIDTSTPAGRFILTVFSAISELERESILQRQKEGIAIAKKNGVYKGRKPVERTDMPAVVHLWREGKITAVEAMRRLQMAPSTFYRKVKQL